MPDWSNDRVLWITAAGGLLIAANAIPYYLHYIRTLSEVEPDEPSPEKGPCEDAETKLDLTTLHTLTTDPSYKLRSSAIRVIAQRSYGAPLSKGLIHDLASQDLSRSTQALDTLRFLLSHPALLNNAEPLRLLTTDGDAFSALVTCLVNLLPLHKTEERLPGRADNPTAGSPILPYCRPRAELTALRILCNSLPYQDIHVALRAGVVSRWLKYYPFPCALPQNGGRRKDVMKYVESWGSDDPLMSQIFQQLQQPAAVNELIRHGLLDPNEHPPYRSFRKSSPGSPNQPAALSPSIDGGHNVELASPLFSSILCSSLSVDELQSTSSSSSSSYSFSSSSNAPTLDFRSSAFGRSSAERAARQRRREAAVFSEGNAPVTQDNIYQRPSPSLAIESTTNHNGPDSHDQTDRGPQSPLPLVAPAISPDHGNNDDNVNDPADGLINMNSPSLAMSLWEWFSTSSPIG